MQAIDGSYGEGGGQILRTSLALSLVTGAPLRIQRIRAGRAKKGLLRQHLTAVRAAAQISGAKVKGAELGSTEITFEPGAVTGGEHRFAIGTAGSTLLVLQTILPALLLAKASTKVTLEGGTHNPAAPPFDFVERSFLPQLAKMGARVSARLVRHGFHPAGGGSVAFEVEPLAKLAPLTLLDRGDLRERHVEARVAGLSAAIAERELSAIAKALGWERAGMTKRAIEDAFGPGNVVMITLASEHVTEVVTGFGQQGVPAETIAEEAAREAARYLAAGVPVGEHLADQLLVPMALAGGGAFRTLAPSRHLETQAWLLPQLLPVVVRVTREGKEEEEGEEGEGAGDAHRVEVIARGR